MFALIIRLILACFFFKIIFLIFLLHCICRCCTVFNNFHHSWKKLCLSVGPCSISRKYTRLLCNFYMRMSISIAWALLKIFTVALIVYLQRRQKYSVRLWSMEQDSFKCVLIAIWILYAYMKITNTRILRNVCAKNVLFEIYHCCIYSVYTGTAKITPLDYDPWDKIVPSAF